MLKPVDDPALLTMRLRPSQFVFFLILVCCLQLGDDCARQLTGMRPAAVPTGSQQQERAYPAAPQRQPARPTRSSVGRGPAGALARQSEAAAIASPAANAAAVAHYTSLLRA